MSCPLSAEKVRAWVRVTLEYPIECDPEYLEPVEDDEVGTVTSGTWHRSMGTWCGDSLVDELEAALRLVRSQSSFGTINSAWSGGCLCDVVVSELVTVKAEREHGPRTMK